MEWTHYAISLMLVQTRMCLLKHTESNGKHVYTRHRNDDVHTQTDRQPENFLWSHLYDGQRNYMFTQRAETMDLLHFFL